MSHGLVGWLALTSVLTIEGTGYAQTTEFSMRAWIEEPDNDSSTVEVLPDAAPTGLTSSSRESADGSVTLRRISLCHISRHPRDGLRPDQHACPLFIAVQGPPEVVPQGVAFSAADTSPKVGPSAACRSLEHEVAWSLEVDGIERVTRSVPAAFTGRNSCGRSAASDTACRLET
jgi:hypothetical protein